MLGFRPKICEAEWIPNQKVHKALRWLKQPLAFSQSPSQGGCTNLFVASSTPGPYFIMMTIFHLHRFLLGIFMNFSYFIPLRDCC